MTSGFVILSGLVGLLAILAVASWNAQRRTRAQLAQLARADLAAPLRAELGQLRLELGARMHQMRESSDAQVGRSFRLMAERLAEVQRGLGEMQSLAAGVGDLRRVLGNVKTRGTWGEVQLGALLADVLSPAQYAANVATRPGSTLRVEYAICLPGADGETVYLPIDAKFPQEDYLRLVEAQEAADPDGAEAAARALEARVRASAREIAGKYVAPPHTTDFAILFLAAEGLYAEVIRRRGVVEALQREHRVMVAGPSTLAALLNSLQLGFRTLAIEQRSREVWAVLGAVKGELDRFGAALDKAQRKLEEAAGAVHQAGVRRRAVERTLRDVQELPAAGDHDDARVAG